MHVCFCDDEQPSHLLVEKLIQEWAKSRKESCEIFHYYSAEELLFEVGNNFAFDLILLDIQMKKLDGIALAKKIREQDHQVMLAFLTGIADHVFEGYEVQAVRYLLKPIQQEKMFELLDLALVEKAKERKYLIIDSVGETKKLYFDEITAIETQGHYLVYHLGKERIQQKNSFVRLREKLSDDFVMTHRSFCVNLAHVIKITRSDCFLDNDEVIPVSRNAYKALNEAFIRFYREGVL